MRFNSALFITVVAVASVSLASPSTPATPGSPVPLERRALNFGNALTGAKQFVKKPFARVFGDRASREAAKKLAQETKMARVFAKNDVAFARVKVLNAQTLYKAGVSEASVIGKGNVKAAQDAARIAVKNAKLTGAVPVKEAKALGRVNVNAAKDAARVSVKEAKFDGQIGVDATKAALKDAKALVPSRFTPGQKQFIKGTGLVAGGVAVGAGTHAVLSSNN